MPRGNFAGRERFVATNGTHRNRPRICFGREFADTKEERQPKEECDNTSFDEFSSRQAYLEYRDAAIGMGEWPYDDEDDRWED